MLHDRQSILAESWFLGRNALGTCGWHLVFGAIVRSPTWIPSFAMSTYLFSTVQLRSLLMEPGAKLFQPMGGLAGVPTEAQHREFIRSLWTTIPFSKTTLERTPAKWQDEILRFSPRLAPTGKRITLSFIGELFEVPKADWVFVRDILQVDPNMRSTADELLRHTWLNS